MAAWSFESLYNSMVETGREMTHTTGLDGVALSDHELYVEDDETLLVSARILTCSFVSRTPLPYATRSRLRSPAAERGQQEPRVLCAARPRPRRPRKVRCSWIPLGYPNLARTRFHAAVIVASWFAPIRLACVGHGTAQRLRLDCVGCTVIPCPIRVGATCALGGATLTTCTLGAATGDKDRE
jgi:hypothetical protein